MIEPLPTTVYSSLYVHIRFRTVRIAIRPNWNDYYTWVKWNELSGSHHFLRLFTNTTNYTISLWMQASFCLVPRHVYLGRIYSSIPKDLKFDRSIQVTWKQGDCESDSFEQTILAWSYLLVQQHESWQILRLLSCLNTVGAAGSFLQSRLLLHNFESLLTCRRSSK